MPSHPCSDCQKHYFSEQAMLLDGQLAPDACAQYRNTCPAVSGHVGRGCVADKHALSFAGADEK